MKLPGARLLACSLRLYRGIVKHEGRFFVMVSLCLLPLFVAGCAHRPQPPEPLAPPIEDAPPPKPLPSPTQLPPPVITVPSFPKETPEPVVIEAPKPAPAPPVKQKKHTPPPPPVVHPSVSAIGLLSSGDPSELQRQTADSIVDTERGLNSIHRSFNEQEKRTAAQIRAFIKQAHAALSSGDIDGAHTLAVKAKVLLGELNQ